jgi:hypothetical protein
MQSNEIEEIERKSAVFLYVPFSDAEASQGLQLMALNWRKAIRESAQVGKILPKVIVHGQKTFDDVPEGSTIYLLAHGVPKSVAKITNQDLTDHVCNTADMKEDEVFYIARSCK